jgi:hypothetical protein
MVAMSKPVRLAVLGAGLIGKRHLQHIQKAKEAIESGRLGKSSGCSQFFLDLQTRRSLCRSVISVA